MFNLVLAIILALGSVAMYFAYRSSKGLVKTPTDAARSKAMAFGSGAAGLFSILSFVFGAAFYAEPGYIYDVRTIFATQKVVVGPAWGFHWYGSTNAWKKALSIQTDLKNTEGNLATEHEGDDTTSAALPAERIVFLDQVDAQVAATVRFKIPDDEATFLHLVREYRNPDNFVRTSLIPAFRETLQANASLMSAESYYAGARTEFANEFENQMKDGIYLVQRQQQTVIDKTVTAKSTADATQRDKQENYGDNQSVVWVVNKLMDKTGLPQRKKQKFEDYGVTVLEARVTAVDPNEAFLKRMQAKQNASAARAVAQEQRIQEEEQAKLAVAKGQREQAEQQAKALVAQIDQTTKAETEKKLVVIEAEKFREQARIEKESAALQLARDQIRAQSTKTLADAEAYAKQRVIQANGALEQKLATYLESQKVWAAAFADYEGSIVPAVQMGGNPASGGSNGMQQFMELMSAKAAKDLALDMKVESGKK